MMHSDCIDCGEDTLEYVGEAYDDEEYLGSTYRCSSCGFHFTISLAEQLVIEQKRQDNARSDEDNSENDPPPIETDEEGWEQW